MNAMMCMYSIVESKNKNSEIRFYIIDSLGFVIRTNPSIFNTYEEAFLYLIKMLTDRLEKTMSKIFSEVNDTNPEDISSELKKQEILICEIINQKSNMQQKLSPKPKNKTP